MRALIPPAMLLLSGACSYSLDREALEIRAEIHRLERSVPPESPLWIDAGPDRFDLVIEDYSERVPEHVHRHLLKKFQAMSAAEAESLCRGDFDRAACEEDPSRFRGRSWRVCGVVGRLVAENPSDPDFPVRPFFSGVLFEPGGKPVLFHVVQKPEVVTLGDDLVETKALFVKIVEYTTRSGRRVVAPFFIGKTLRRVL